MERASRGRAKIGVVVPITNSNLEPDMVLLRPDGVSMHYARAGGYDPDEVPASEQMQNFALGSLDEIIFSLAAVRPDLILYGCTSATLAHGPEFDLEFCEKIKQMAGVGAATAAGALVLALGCLGVSKIAFSSPYVAALNDEAIGFLEESGFETVSRMDVEEDLGNYGQGVLIPDEVYELGRKADSEAAEALEKDLCKPVVTSNQALMFAASVMLGLEPAFVPAYGVLLSDETIARAQAEKPLAA